MENENIKFGKNEFSQYSFRKKLENDFAQRKLENPKFSLRSFARMLETDSSTLKKILNGKRPLGSRTIQKLGSKIGLSEKDILLFIEFQKQKRELGIGLKDDKIEMEYRVLGKENVPLIRTPYSYAVIELLKIPNFDLTPENVSTALKIPVNEADSVLTLMKKFNWIAKNENGTWESRIGNTTVDPLDEETQEARTELMHSIINSSLKSFEDVPKSVQTHSANTFAIDRALLPEAILKIKALSRELEKLMSTKSQSPNDVYQLQIGFFPISSFHERRPEGK